jgi:hypothetical protein
MRPTTVTSPALRAPMRRHVRSFAVVIAALVMGMIGWSGSAGAQTQPRLKLQNLTVLDGDGNPFPGTAGVIYCAGADPCQLALADAHGKVSSFFVNPNVDYQMFGFAANTGWGCGGWIPPQSPSEVWYFGASTTAIGRTYAQPTTFVVPRPHCTGLHILNAATNQPFALGHTVVRVCPVVGCVADGPGANVVYAVADANGDVSAPNLDPAIEYEFLAMATDIEGWNCPGYTDPNSGVSYWFAPTVTGTPLAIEGTTFSISDNC